MNHITRGLAHSPQTCPAAPLRWDIFCRVIDNFGDIGVCWRLAAQLAGRGHAVRLWTDDAAALAWMAPGGCAGVEVRQGVEPESGYEPADIVIEAFGAPLPERVVEALARLNDAPHRRVAWINLEYLSAEPHAAASHGLASPVHGGVGAGVRKWFFFPGFTEQTGGLLREPDLQQRQAAFDRPAWLRRHGITDPEGLGISLFCYEPQVLAPWLLSLARLAAARPVNLLVTHGRAQAAVRAALAQLPAGWNPGNRVRIHGLPQLTQADFDHLLWSCDVNFVRGEDSMVRALLAGTPFIWQLYPQDDGAHRAKLEAFLGVLDEPLTPGLREYFRWWNGAGEGAGVGDVPDLQTTAWQGVFRANCGRITAQADLVTRLLRFVAENR